MFLSFKLCYRYTNFTLIRSKVRVVCAFIELIDGKSLSEDEIESFCREHLAGFKRPKKVIFCELPKTSTGKIQKYELRVRARSAEC